MAKLKTRTGVKEHKVVSSKDWIAARRKLLAKEKKFTRLHDELARERRRLPWVKMEKNYVFDGPDGRETLADLFDGKRQLIVYHFMFGPGWGEGCPHCSFWADNFNGLGIHLAHRDTTMIAVSRAPWKEIAPFLKRMGWGFKWVSSANNDFNFDLQVSFTPEEMAAKKAFYNFEAQDPLATDREGVSAFYKDGKNIYRTYSTHARGIDILNNVYNYLDLTAKGRDEDPERTQEWVRYHDRYKK